jgi:hypothetical protein
MFWWWAVSPAARSVLLSLMGATMNTADMMIYVHPDLDAMKRMDLEKNLLGRIGVDCAEFEHRPHPHSLMVKYDPDAVRSVDILQMVRKLDPKASMVGM